jgi:hypothetical protein
LQNADPTHTYDYQFNAGNEHEGQQTVRDFNTSNSATFTTIAAEGDYQVSVVVRDTSTQPATVFPQANITYVLTPWVEPSAHEGVVNPTQHPLVALFSAPACPQGNYLRVRFQLVSGAPSYTDWKPCQATTMNFHVAGMLPQTQYMMNREEFVGSSKTVVPGAKLPFQTGTIPGGVVLPSFTLLQAAPAESQEYPVILHGFFDYQKPYPITATDLAGNVIWYSPVPFTLIGHSEFNGRIMGLFSEGRDPHQQILREADLAGNITLETNASIVNEQLAALAAKNNQKPVVIYGFHHEARRLVNGNIMVLGQEDLVSSSAQGGTAQNPVDILADVVLILDSNLQVLWYWDSFAHLDISRTATLGDLCNGQPSCLPFNPTFTIANDWLHSNSAQITSDGNILLSVRNQDWILKIDYRDGIGDGHVIWRLGNGGDFLLLNPADTTCADPGAFLWFSHQHDPEFQFNDDVIGGVQFLTLFDNGNTRRAKCDPASNSRAVLLTLDEPDLVVNMTAPDLGAYSGALGAAQFVTYSSGAFMSVDNGAIGGAPNGNSQSVELDASGNVRFKLQVNDALTYRSFRMTDLYHPPTQ